MSGCVTFRNVGRLGNVLFEAATAMAYAWRHGMEFTVPTGRDAHRDSQWHPVYFQHLANPRYNASLPVVRVEEKTHAFHEIHWDESWRDKNVVLHGYWQSEKYFKDVRDRVIDAFGFPWHSVADSVSVHVRRGDYLTIKKGGMCKHPPVPKEWISAAMAKFPGAQFAFFSDDIEWCKATWGNRDDCDFDLDRFLVDYHDRRPEVLDLILGSWCEHHICSASTFSWWQAWLNRNPDKRVIMPKHWITPEWGHGLDMRDIVPAEWERV